jgi:hypothetical protein
MGLEFRGNRPRYYRKHWNGGEVRGEYVGSGMLALLAATLDEERREEAREETEAERSELAELAVEEARIAAYLEEVDRAVSDALRAAGYHRPSRKLQWMKCHGRRNEEIHISGRVD